MHIDIRQLRYFVAVAEELNFGRAAEKLHISQPPVTRQVQQLEQTLGSPLFVRHAKGVTLTPEGALFLEEAKAMLTLLEQAAEKVKHARNGELGRIDVAIFGSAVFGRIPEIVLAFRRKYPAVKVALHTMSKQRQLDGLLNRSVDVAFNRLMTPQNGLIIEELSREPLYIAVADSSELAQMDAVPFSELGKHPLVLFPTSKLPGFIDKVRDMCASAGFVPNIAQEVGDAVSGLALVASGFGICIVPESILNVHLPGTVFRPICDFDGDLTLDLSCVYRSNEHAPVIENFLSVARDVCGTAPNDTQSV